MPSFVNVVVSSHVRARRCGGFSVRPRRGGRQRGGRAAIGWQWSWSGCLLAVYVCLGGLPATVRAADDTALVGNGGFEDVSDAGDLAGWKMNRPNTWVEGDAGTRHLVVSPRSDKAVTWVEQAVMLDPSWRKIRVSVRMRVSGLRCGDGEQGAILVGMLTGADGKGAGYIKAPQLKADTADWVELSEETTLPEGAATLTLMPAVMAGAGEVRYDDIRVAVTDADRGVAAAGRTWHVATGADNGDGSEAKPFNRIQAAADVARAGDVVLIRAGTYRESVRPAHSGQSVGGGSYITYKPADDKPVIISGADPVIAPWQPVPGKSGVWTTRLPASFESQLNQAEQLFVDGRMMVDARFPNTPFQSLDVLRTPRLHMDRMTDAGTTPGKEPKSGWRRMTIHDAEITVPDGSWKGARIYFTPRHGEGEAKGDDGGGWGFAIGGVIVEQSRGKLVADIAVGPEGIGDKSRHMYAGGEPYYVEGTLPLLDHPGEWVRDGQTLYLHALPGADPNQAKVELKRRDYAFDLTDRSYVRIEGIHVFAATVTTDQDASPLRGAGGGSDVTPRGRKDVAPSHHVVLDGLRFKYVNHFTDQTGWEQGQWVQTSGVVVSGRHNVIENCVIEYAAGNGLLLLGERSRASNNIIHSTNYRGVFAAALSMGMESPNRDCEIANNTVYGTGFDGIMVQGLTSSSAERPSRVHHNRVSEFGILSRDVGGIKVVGHGEHRTMNRWDHNHVSDAGGWSMGLYQDFAGSTVLDHNVVWNVEDGANINEGKFLRIYNNTLLGDRQGIGGGTHYLLTDVKLLNNIVTAKLGELKLKDCVVGHNVEDAEPSMFANPAEEDFRLASGSRAVDAGVEIVEYVSATKGPVDVGAYQLGDEAWGTGSSVALPIGRPTNVKAERQADGSVRLTWTDHANGERHYYVERSLRPSPRNGWREFERLVELPPDTTTWIDDSPEAAVNSPRYRVRADDSMVSNTARLRAPLGLVLRLDFEETLESTAPYKLGAAATATKGKAVFSKQGKVGDGAVVFEDKNQQRIEIPDHPALNPGESGSILFWMKPTRWPGGNRVIFRKAEGERIQYGLNLHGGSIVFSAGYGPSVSIDRLPPEEKWTHVALTFSRRQLHIYFDGQLVASKALPGWESVVTPATGGPLVIGGPTGDAASNAYFNGLIDDMRVYADQVLTQDEIREAASK